MGAQAAVRGVTLLLPPPPRSDCTGWIHSFCFKFLNSNSNSLTVKKLNSNSLTLKKLNSNSLILQKSNSNSNSISSIIRERILIQNSNPTLTTNTQLAVFIILPVKSRGKYLKTERDREQKSLESTILSDSTAVIANRQAA